ncbi:MAG: TlpA disulfide reductase family protein [Rhodocyclaceae bacterium]|nr:TlpA disulfide reductase family protein [Rhodocyclaceae bacterium]MDZ4215286.1 TlpA disulfide reductase family protein [Rhodocyclaceae bacterium]
MSRFLSLLATTLVLIWPTSLWAQSSSELFAANLIDLQGQPTAMNRWQGSPLIVNFWARWCGPCRQEIPELIKLRQAYRNKGLEVLGIALEDKVEPVRDFAKAYEMDYPVLLAQDKGLALMKALGNTKMGLPFTVAIDRNGKIVLVKMGLITGSELAAAAETVLR